LGRTTLDESMFGEHPPEVVPGLSDVVELAAGGDVTWALTAQGKLYRWGASYSFDNGEDPLVEGSGVPVEITTVNDVRGIVAGFAGACGITSTGSVRCWGSNQCGELGDPAAASGVSEVPGVSDVEALAYDEAAVCALRGDGSVTCWGAIAEAGSYVCAREPATPITGLPVAVSIATFTERSCTLDAEGHVNCFNPSPGCGSLDPCPPAAYAPAPLPELDGVTRLLGDTKDICGVQANGALRCVRYHYDFASGTWRSQVYVRSEVSEARAVATGQTRTCAVDGANLVWCWNDVDEALYPLALPE
jgi:hypothetical protein